MPWPDLHESARRVLHEPLPLDAERRAEMQVWLAFTMRSLTDPELRPLRDEAHTGLRTLCRDVVAALGAADPSAKASGCTRSSTASRCTRSWRPT